jgi:hypothetical protein
VTELSAQQRWILRPLTDAGLTDDQACDLVVRLAFEATVCGGGLDPSRLGALVAGRPLGVRSAWIEVLDRMMSAPGEPDPST